MEIEINKEIRDYNESIFFGLTLRQCVFSALALGISVGMYFVLSPFMPTAAWSLICILCAVPFAAIGFIRYNGMYAEEFIVFWLRSLFAPKYIAFVSSEKTGKKRKEKSLENISKNKKRR